MAEPALPPRSSTHVEVALDTYVVTTDELLARR
jgi:hypothetical protein